MADAILPRLVRTDDGGLRVTLPLIERTLLLDMAETLRDVIADVDADTPPDELTGRLFPRAYEDPLEQMAYAESTMSPLAEGKRTMLDTFEASLAGGRTTERRWSGDLDVEQISAWIAVLQDGRQVLARVVGIRTETDWESLEDSGEDVAVVLRYLGDLLNAFVVLMMGQIEQ